MDLIKSSENVVFDVIYADGTKHRVEEGVLIEVQDTATTFHNGTNRLVVLFAAIEALFEVVSILNVWDLFERYIGDRHPEEKK